MPIEKVKNYFKKLGLEKSVMELGTSSATVELAALALGCAPGRIAKTLSFLVPESAILIVVAGDVKVDNKKFREKFGVKAKMLQFDEVEPLIGHGVGGVCPFAVNENVGVYLDDSLKKYDYVFPACGSENSAIKLTTLELEQYASNFQGWVDVCKEKDA